MHRILSFTIILANKMQIWLPELSSRVQLPPDSEEQLQKFRLSNAMKAVVAPPNEAVPPALIDPSGRRSPYSRSRTRTALSSSQEPPRQQDQSNVCKNLTPLPTSRRSSFTPFPFHYWTETERRRPRFFCVRT
jgi:hypothetical protein